MKLIEPKVDAIMVVMACGPPVGTGHDRYGRSHRLTL
jgi:hypothetical protein